MEYEEIVHRCFRCGYCKFTDDLLNIFEAARAELVTKGLIPPAVRDYFKAILVNGNPYKEPQNKRGKWAEGTSIQPFSDQEFLFYVGDVGSYDEPGKKMAMSVGSLLSEAGLSIGILGSKETSDGNDVKVLGEIGLFKKLAEDNIRMFNEIGIKKIITLALMPLIAFQKN